RRRHTRFSRDWSSDVCSSDLAERFPECHAALLEAMRTLEQHYRDMCDIEFTIERGRLYLLQTRVGKRTAAAALRMAVDMVAEGRSEERRVGKEGSRHV